MRSWLESGASVVTANMEPLVGPLSDFRALLAPGTLGRFRFGCAFGAGNPYVSATLGMLLGGDEIRRIEGTFNNALGYIAARLQDGFPFGRLVREAYEQGYTTQPDPRLDLSGTLVARQALVLGRLLGWDLSISDVRIESLVSPAAQTVSVVEYLAGLGKDVDDVFHELAFKGMYDSSAYCEPVCLRMAAYQAVFDTADRASQTYTLAHSLYA